MKYLIKAMKQSKLIYLAVLQLVLTAIELFIGAKILLWITDVVENYDDPLYYIELILMGCLINIIIHGILSYIHIIASTMLYTNLHNMMTNKLANADYELFVKYSPGELISISHGIFKLSKLVRLITGMIIQVISIVINLYMICSIQIRLLLPMAIIYSIGFMILYKINKVWNKLDVEKETMSIKRDSKFDELVNGFMENRTFNAHPEKEIISMNGQILDILRKRSKLSVILNNSIMSIDTIGMMAIIFFGIHLLQNGLITEPVVVAMVMYAWRIIDPVMTLVNGISDYSEYISPLPKLNNIMEYEDKIVDGSTELVSFDSSIVLNHVKFSYNKSDLVLNDISFVINKGERIGICGVSGGGKTTLLKLIPRMYDCNSGSISIDGINIKDIKRDSIKKYMGTVHQDVYIFNKNVMENIRYAKSSASDLEVIEASRKADAYDFISSLPGGFNTEVGPKGLKLSGGQKQRIALARIFLSNPEIVLLDEATSALDTETEKFIQESLDALKGKTVIAVAHRLSTIKNFDKIIVIDQHKIAEVGTHDSLITKGGIYADLWNKSIKENENVV